jgi:hypothetical protein
MVTNLYTDFISHNKSIPRTWYEEKTEAQKLAGQVRQVQSWACKEVCMLLLELKALYLQSRSSKSRYSIM